MPIDAHHWFILISMGIYVEHIIYTLLDNQNISLCVRKLVELKKESRYVNSEDTFTESIIQVKIYVTWYRFQTQV